jgi:hypothetical protein
VDNQRKEMNEFLLITGTLCFNFYCEEDCPQNFRHIYNIIEKMRRNSSFNNEKDLLYGEYEKSMYDIKNISKLKQFLSDDERLGKVYSSNFSSSFNYEVLEKIIENSDAENLVEMSLSTDVDILEIIHFMLNYSMIQSIFFNLSKIPNISIRSSISPISGRNRIDYIFYDVMFILFLFFFINFNIFSAGFIKYVDNNGSIYEGECKDEIAHRNGKWINCNGEIYEGEFKEGIPHGKVKYSNSKGDFYSGDYNNGIQSGKGVYFHGSGNIYSGNFLYGMPNGKGIFFFMNGDIYSGNFSNGLPNEKGMYFYSNGKTYSGKYKEGKRDGNGVMLFADGSIYSGLFENGSTIGKGKLLHTVGYIDDNYELRMYSNSRLNVMNNAVFSADMKKKFEKVNNIKKLITSFFQNNIEMFKIFNKKIEKNMNDSINLRDSSNNINIEEIIFNLLSNIHNLGKSSILFSLISKRSSSNSFFSSHTVLLYVYYQEIGRRGIVIIDSLFLFCIISL